MHEAMLAAKNNPPPPPANESDRSAQAEFGPSVSAPDASSNNNSKLCDNMKNVWGDSYQEGSRKSDMDDGFGGIQSSVIDNVSAKSSSTGSGSQGRSKNRSSREDRDRVSGTTSPRYWALRELMVMGHQLGERTAI